MFDDFFLPLKEPIKKDGTLLCCLLFMALIFGITLYFSNSIMVIIMSLLLSFIISIIVYCLIKKNE